MGSVQHLFHPLDHTIPIGWVQFQFEIFPIYTLALKRSIFLTCKVGWEFKCNWDGYHNMIHVLDIWPKFSVLRAGRTYFKTIRNVQRRTRTIRLAQILDRIATNVHDFSVGHSTPNKHRNLWPSSMHTGNIQEGNHGSMIWWRFKSHRLHIHLSVQLYTSSLEFPDFEFQVMTKGYSYFAAIRQFK